jgi:hypothetical protein
MQWFNVDGARDYLAQRGPKPSRKTVYNMAAAGMKVAHIGESGRRLMFCAEWVDAFLAESADTPAPALARHRA